MHIHLTWHIYNKKYTFKIFKLALNTQNVCAGHDPLAWVFLCSPVININYKIDKRDTHWGFFLFCGPVKSTKHFTSLHFWCMYSKVTSHSLNFILYYNIAKFISLKDYHMCPFSFLPAFMSPGCLSYANTEDVVLMNAKQQNKFFQWH